MKLTKTIVDKAKYDRADGGRSILWDSEVSGFGLRLYPSGKKSFVVSYRSKGRKHLLTLGAYGVLTLQQGRDQAKLMLAQVIGGENPVLNRRREQQGETMADLADAYLERYAKPFKRSWRSDEKRIQRSILPKWGPQRVRDISRSEVASFHHEIGKRAKYEANRTIALLSRMFGLAQEWGILDEASANPAKGISKFKEEKRDRWVSETELPKLASVVAQEKNLYVQSAFWLYLLTGVRKSELLQAKWEDVNFTRFELRLPKTKAGRVHYVPLNPPAMKLLIKLSLRRQPDNPYILVGNRKGAPLVNISKAWSRIRKASGLEDVRLHDLRRTVGSYLAQSGHSLQLIGKVLNHTNVSTTQVYAHLAENQARKALEAHGSKLESLIPGEIFEVFA
ncbi:MAG: site-specific integrase [Bdellovibrionota bacterium]